jgi:glycine C-acetyltransferase
LSATAAVARRSAASKAVSTSSPARWAKRSVAHPAASRPGRKEIVEVLRQRSRPYLFSNTLAPSIAAASLRVLELLAGDEGTELRLRVRRNGERFRAAMTSLGFDLVPGAHPIIPVMLGDAALATRMADALLAEGVYVIGFSYPVVPKGKARIRTQMSAAHTADQIDLAVAAFAKVGRALGAIKEKQ